MIHHSEGFGKKTLCGKDSDKGLSSYNWNVVDCPICLQKGEVGPSTREVLGSLGLIGITLGPLVWLFLRYVYNH